MLTTKNAAAPSQSHRPPAARLRRVCPARDGGRVPGGRPARRRPSPFPKKGERGHRDRRGAAQHSAECGSTQSLRSVIRKMAAGWAAGRREAARPRPSQLPKKGERGHPSRGGTGWRAAGGGSVQSLRSAIRQIGRGRAGGRSGAARLGAPHEPKKGERDHSDRGGAASGAAGCRRLPTLRSAASRLSRAGMATSGATPAPRTLALPKKGECSHPGRGGAGSHAAGHGSLPALRSTNTSAAATTSSGNS